MINFFKGISLIGLAFSLLASAPFIFGYLFSELEKDLKTEHKPLIYKKRKEAKP
jgi:hypothetical protein